MSDQPNAPRRALIVIDAQLEYFVGELVIEHPPRDASLANIVQAMDAARDAAIPIIIVQHCSPAGAVAFPIDGPTWELHPDVASRPFQHRIEKRWPSAFKDTDLEQWLQTAGIDTLTVAGYMTQNCDLATIVHAHHLGLAVEFLTDASGTLPYANAVGSATAEEIHRVLSVVFHGRMAAVATTAAWIDAVAQEAALPTDDIISSHRRGVANASNNAAVSDRSENTASAPSERKLSVS